MKTIFASLSLVLLVISVSNFAFAQTTYDVNIPTGAASPDAPYFWQSEKDGTTTGIVKILTGDTITWKNADTAAHTVTSGTARDGPDDVFDSGLFGPGKSFSYEFTEEGNYPYFCLIHPWMEGTIIVSEGYAIIPNVGKNAGDGSIKFDVEYDFNRVLSTATVNESEKSISFEIVGVSKSDDHTLEILLPTALIDGPFTILLDDGRIAEFENVKEDGMNILYVALDAETEQFTIMGTSVVPEFGILALFILSISIIALVVMSKSGKLPLLRY